MAERQVERRLAAILAADVAGYSRLVGADEEGTLARLRTLRKDVIDPAIAQQQGRIVKTTGDGILIEFASVVAAMRAALETQRAMAARNAGVPPDRRIDFRMGINLGDVVVEPDGDLMGDGVNVAARLEGIAEPGGICLSASAFDQVRDRIAVEFTDLGEHALKNIARPVRVYAAEIGTYRPAAVAGEPTTRPAASFRRPVIAVALALALIVIAGGAWRFYGGSAGSPAPVEAKRLSIVVLPFTNLSRDASQDYLADVLTEELTTRVSRLPGSFVVSRTTAFTYRDKKVDVKQIGKELNVRYALEGSAQKSGSRLRVNAQLIDAATGAHLWADQFDADFADLLEMQDKIVTRLGRSLQIELADIEARRLDRARPGNPDADDLAMQCEAAFLRFGPMRPEGQEGMKACERALQIDDHNVRALELLAARTAAEINNNRTADLEAARRRAEELLSRALALDPNSYLAHYAKAAVMVTARPEEALVEAERALALNPSFAPAYLQISLAHWTAGRPEKAIDVADQGLRLFPQDPNAFFLLGVKGAGFFNLLRYEDAIDSFRRAIAANPNYAVGYLGLTTSLALSGHKEEASETLRRYLALPGNNPKTIAQYKAQSPYARLASLNDFLARWYEGLRKAGMPEE